MNKLTSLVVILLSLPQNGLADQNLFAVRVEQLPLVDGIADDSVWQRASPIKTYDHLSNTEIELRAVYSTDGIAFLAQYLDTTETRQHKSLNWDAKDSLYKVGPQREDALIFKWGMDSLTSDLTLQSDTPYMADIWYWKSYRSDHAGYADDKYQVYSEFKVGIKNKRLIGRNGASFYFSRHGDAGQSAYKSLSPSEYSGDNIAGYRLRTPMGSRADVRAKGRWHDNRWSIEFSRKLDTGHIDDVLLSPDKTYFFGVSRYEIAARKPNPAIDPPNYGAGEITERLQLRFLP